MQSPAVVSLAIAVPQRFTQEETYALAGYRSARAQAIFMNSDIEQRHLWLDPATFTPAETRDQMHARYEAGAFRLACLAARQAIDQAHISVRELDAIFIATCTGYSCPDLATRLAGHLGMREDVQRGALLGHGCAGALPLLQRAHDFAAARPGSRVLAIAVEICSACYFFDDTMETLVGNAICADGAAAAILSTTRVDSAHPVPRLLAFQSQIDPANLDKVGFEQRDGRLRIILSAEIRDLAGPIIEKCLHALFARVGLTRDMIRHWVLHPGGRKVLDKVSQHLALPAAALQPARHILRHYGNMSSPTALFVLDEVQRTRQPANGDYGILLALGPGFVAEAALLRWS